MPFVHFYEHFLELAEAETRVLTIPHGDPDGLPADSYAFCEMFCNERGCDCRRVFFSVFAEAQQRTVAIVAYGWETKAFYAKWMGDSELATLQEIQGPALNLGSPQSPLAPAILQLTKEVLLKDPAYIERIRRHYALFRQKIDSKKRRRKPKGKGFGP